MGKKNVTLGIPFFDRLVNIVSSIHIPSRGSALKVVYVNVHPQDWDTMATPNDPETDKANKELIERDLRRRVDKSVIFA